MEATEGCGPGEQLAADMRAQIARWDRRRKDGDVYFLRCGNFIKIGFSTDLVARRAALQTANPMTITVAGTVKGTLAMEREIRRVCAEHHHQGEWFKASADLLAAIKIVAKRRRVARKPAPQRLSYEERTKRRWNQHFAKLLMKGKMT